ncbi:hypothetical protein BH11PAT4_BH11PAT4_6460 [soil metagenome]
MNPKVLAGIIVAVVLIGGGATYAQTKKTKDDEKMAMEKASMEKDAMAKDTMEKDSMEKDAMAKDTMGLKGSFVAYDTAKLADAEKGKVVLFFSASWCPTCQAANKNLTSSTAPDGLTLLKVDYDNSTELKQKYGVTYQHTFVQVDASGKLLKKWSGSETYSAITSQAI